MPTPLVNGHLFSYASIEPFVNGLPVLGKSIRSINYSETGARTKVRGGGQMALGRTAPQYDVENASLEILKEHLDAYLTALTGGNPNVGYMEVPHQIQVAYQDLNAPLVEDQLVGCVITGIEDGHSQSAEGLVVRVSLDVMYLIRGGKLPLNVDAMLR
jgi:hypothetical protein